MRTWYQSKGRYCLCKLCAIMHRAHRFSLGILQACVHHRKRTMKPQRSQQVALKMAIEKQTTHATWTQPPLKNLLTMPDIITENIFKCITRCLIMVATISAKIIIILKIYSSVSQDVWLGITEQNVEEQYSEEFGCCIPEKIAQFKAK